MDTYGKGNVNTRRGSDNFLGGWLIELPETIRERSSGVDDTLEGQLKLGLLE